MDDKPQQKHQNQQINALRPLPTVKKQKVHVQSQMTSKYHQMIGQLSSQTKKRQLINKLLKQYIYFSQKAYSQKLRIRKALYSDNKQILVLTVCYGPFQAQLNILLVNEQSQTHQLEGLGNGAFGNIYAACFEERKIVVKCIAFNEKTFTQVFQLTLKEYLLNKIASCLQSGPLLISNYFDLTIYSECIQFFQQRCKNIEEIKIDAAKMRQQLCAALQRLHSLSIVHFDIKPQNLCFSALRNKYILIDFGLSEAVDDQVGFLTLTAFKGSLRYCSPNMLALYDHKQYIQRSIDVYYNDAYALNQVIIQFQSKQQYEQGSDSQMSQQQNQVAQIMAMRMQIYSPKHKPKVTCNLFEKNWLSVIKYYLFTKSERFCGLQQMIDRQRKLISFISSNPAIQRNIQKVLALKSQNRVIKINQLFFNTCFTYLTNQEEHRGTITNSYNQAHHQTNGKTNKQSDNLQTGENKEAKRKIFDRVQQHCLSSLANSNVSIGPLIYNSFSLEYLLKNHGLMQRQQQRNIHLLQLSYSLQINNNQFSYEQRKKIANAMITHYQISCKKFNCSISTCLEWLFKQNTKDDSIQSIILSNTIQSVIILELLDQQQIVRAFDQIPSLKIAVLKKLKLIIKFLRSIYWIRNKLNTRYSFYDLEEQFVFGLAEFGQSYKQDKVLFPYMNLVFGLLQYRLRSQNTNYFLFFYASTCTPEWHIRPEFFIEDQLPLNQTKQLLRQIQRYVTYIHFDYLIYFKRSNHLPYQWHFMFFQSLGQLDVFAPYQQFTFGHVIQSFYLTLSREDSGLLKLQYRFAEIFKHYSEYDNLLVKWEFGNNIPSISSQNDLALKLENMRKIKKLFEKCLSHKKITVFGLLTASYIEVLSSPNSHSIESEIEQVLKLDQKTFRQIFYSDLSQQNNRKREFHRHKLYQNVQLISSSYVSLLRIKNGKKTLEEFDQTDHKEFRSFVDHFMKQIEGFYCLECKEQALIQAQRFLQFLLHFQKKHQLLIQLIIQLTLYNLKEKCFNPLLQNLCLLYTRRYYSPEIQKKYEFSTFSVDTISNIPTDARQKLLTKQRMELFLLSIIDESIQQQARFIQLLVSTVQVFPSRKNIITFYGVVKETFNEIKQNDFHKLLDLVAYLKCIKHSPICLVFQVMIPLFALTSKGISKDLLKKTALLLNNVHSQTKKIIFREYYKRFMVLFDVSNSRQKIYVQRKHLKSIGWPVNSKRKITKLLVEGRKYRSSKTYKCFSSTLKCLQRLKKFL